MATASLQRLQTPCYHHRGLNDDDNGDSQSGTLGNSRIVHGAASVAPGITGTHIEEGTAARAVPTTAAPPPQTAAHTVPDVVVPTIGSRSPEKAQPEESIILHTMVPQVSPPVELRLPSQQHAPPTMLIVPGYRPGFLGGTLALHMSYYSATWRFGAAFEAGLAVGFGDLLRRLHRPGNEVWSALMVPLGQEQDQEAWEQVRMVGSIIIDGEDLMMRGAGAPAACVAESSTAEDQNEQDEDGGNRDAGASRHCRRHRRIAHLRGFIVDGSVRGRGVGSRLLAAAMDFVRREGFDECHLWTFTGLVAAIHMYEAVGFRVREKADKNLWGHMLEERHYVWTRE